MESFSGSVFLSVSSKHGNIVILFDFDKFIGMESSTPKVLTKGLLGKDKKLRAEIITTSKLKKDFERSLRTNDLLLKESSG